MRASELILVLLCACSLEERILSAVSQQILTIQTGLKQHQDSITLIGEESSWWNAPDLTVLRSRLQASLCA